MKSNYNGFRGWLNYIRDYKDNKDFTSENLREKELNDKINKLEDELEKSSYIAREKDNLLALKDKRIEAMGNKISNYAKRNDELRSVIETMSKENDIIKEQLEIKELARRKNAGAIGGLKAKINILKLDLERANHKINFLEHSKHAPSKEEIIAYETNMKEVYKKIQEKHKKDID